MFKLELKKRNDLSGQSLETVEIDELLKAVDTAVDMISEHEPGLYEFFAGSNINNVMEVTTSEREDVRDHLEDAVGYVEDFIVTGEDKDETESVYYVSVSLLPFPDDDPDEDYYDDYDLELKEDDFLYSPSYSE